jgi:hypothetical protein
MPVLTPSECSALLLLLNNTSRSFGTAANEFRSTFKADDILRACCSICLLLEVCQLHLGGLESPGTDTSC